MSQIKNSCPTAIIAILFKFSSSNTDANKGNPRNAIVHAVYGKGQYWRLIF